MTKTMRKPKCQLTPTDNAAILALYLSGLYVSDIAAQFNCSEYYVYTTARRLGAPKRSRSDATRRVWADPNSKMRQKRAGTRNAVFARDNENQYKRKSRAKTSR